MSFGYRARDFIAIFKLADDLRNHFSLAHVEFKPHLLMCVTIKLPKNILSHLYRSMR